MGFCTTTFEPENALRENLSSVSKSASREIFSSNRNHVYQIERNPLETQQEKLNSTYKTASGRSSWPSRDPIEEDGGVNLYAFVENDPNNYSDELGKRKVKLRFEAFIPNNLGKNIKNSPKPNVKWIGEPDPFSNKWFSTDDRAGKGSKGSSKGYAEATIDTNNIGELVNTTFSGDSDPSFRIRVGIKRARRNGGRVVSRTYVKDSLEQRRADAQIASNVKDMDSDRSILHVGVSTSYPWKPLGFIPVPAVNFSPKWDLCDLGNEILVTLSGSHNDFPSYQAWVDGKVLYHHKAIGSGPGIGNLSLSTSINKVSVKIKK